MDRRSLVLGGGLAVWVPAIAFAGERENAMYGLISTITAVSGKRDQLIGFIAGDPSEMPGCISYVVASDAADPDRIWVSEVWEGKEAHAASLELPAVVSNIEKARPMIAGMKIVAETVPVAAPKA